MFTVCLVEETQQPHPFMGWGSFCTCKPGESEEVYPWAIAFPWEIRIICKTPVCSHTLTYDLSLFILHFTSHLCVSMSSNLLMGCVPYSFRFISLWFASNVLLFSFHIIPMYT